MEKHPLIQTQLHNCFSNLENLSEECRAFIEEVNEAYNKFENDLHLLRTIIDNLPDDIYVKDVNSRKIFVNPVDIKNTGQQSSADILGKDDFAVYPKEIAERFFADDQLVIKSGKPLFNREEYIIDEKGEKNWLLTSKIPLRNGNGEVIGLIGIGHNITDRKRLEEHVRQSQKMESVGALAGGIAHDFNNILGIVLAYITYMQSDAYDEKMKEENIAAVTTAIKRGSNLVGKLRSFAKQTDKKTEPINFTSLTDELIALLRPTFPRMIEFSVVIEKDLPKLVADQSQIHQALFNLCVNARDAMPGGGIISLHVDSMNGAALQNQFPTAASEQYIHIQVADTGTGMDEKTLNRIFEPFFTTKGNGIDTGLGLSVVYGIIRSHDGYVDVESKIGSGTTFHLYLPAQSADAQTDQLHSDSSAQPKGGTETLLLVEDEELLLSFLKSILESVGYRVLTADDGTKALAMYKNYKQEIALILTDVELPKLSGVEVMQKIREEDPGIPIIFASGSEDPLTVEGIKQITGSALIQKPFDPRKVLLKIRELLISK